MTATYNASVVKVYKTTSSLEMKKKYSEENSLGYYVQRWRCT
jgi:hypothetical protein